MNPAAPRRLHIGGTRRTPGWEILDALARPEVDHVGDARDLSRFAPASFGELYASHVLEHFGYVELVAVLQEWRRVLVPGGLLYLSVPDLDVLADLFACRPLFSAEQRFELMRMMFGGQTTDWDFHKVGLNQEFLGHFLTQAGYVRLRRVPAFGLFEDASTYRWSGVPISLNLIAERPAA
jgi:predicted SAM-dependent methyltransferase